MNIMKGFSNILFQKYCNNIMRFLPNNLLLYQYPKSISLSKVCEANRSITKLVLAKNCSEDHEIMKQIIRNNREVKQLKQSILDERVICLKQLGFSLESIQLYPRVLLLAKGYTMYHFYHLKELQFEQESLLKILTFSQELFTKFTKVCKRDLSKYKQHRVQLISSSLRITQLQLLPYIEKYEFLLKLSYDHLQKVLKLLIEHKVSSVDILSDPWVLRCRGDSILGRLSTLRQAEVENIKPWMVRCTKNVFKGFLNRFTSEQTLLGELSLEEYLSKRLNCSVLEIKEVIDREPQLQKTSILKLKHILDFLISSGFSTNQILLGLPRVANRRIETVHSRLIELQQLGILPSIYVISKSVREYEEYVHKWKKIDK